MTTKLAEYFDEERGRAAKLAKATCQAPSFLRAIADKKRPCPVKVAVLIEVHTGGAVPRKELCADWPEIWPELVAADSSVGSTAQPAA
jgi:DNA-binding transcriptional regulator YdaS (Cro superfamily)